METAYMVFYINKLAIQARPIPLRFLSALTVEETKAVEDLWFADRNPDCSALETHDVQTCWGTQNLNDKIICTYIKSISTKDSGVKVCILSSIIYSQIEEGNSSWEYQNAIQDKVLSNDLLIIPVHHPGPIGHWTLAGIFSSKKLIMHLDSMHCEWKLVAPTDIPRQVDVINCGVYACMNALCLVKRKMLPISPGNIAHLHYFIVHEANKFTKPLFKSRKKEREHACSWRNQYFPHITLNGNLFCRIQLTAWKA